MTFVVFVPDVADFQGLLLELQCLRLVPDQEVLNQVLEAYLHAVERQMGATPSIDLLESICVFFRDVPRQQFSSQVAQEYLRDTRYLGMAPSTTMDRAKAATISLLRSVVNGTELELPGAGEAVEAAEDVASHVLGEGEDDEVTEEKSAAEHKRESDARDSSKFNNVQATVKLLYAVFAKIQGFHAQNGNAEQLCSLLRLLNELLDQVGELQVEGLTEHQRDGSNGMKVVVFFSPPLLLVVCSSPPCFFYLIFLFFFFFCTHQSRIYLAPIL